jgi:hypothetical protein
MQSDKIVCKLCSRELILGEAITCGFRGVTTYECLDEKECKGIVNIEKNKKDAIKIKELEEREKYKHLDQVAQLKMLYDINFDDLEELQVKFRDCSVHYYCELNDSFYSWMKSGNYWYKPTFDLRQYI